VARKRILWQLFPYHLIIIVLSLVAVTFYASHVAERLYLRSTEESLLARARLAEGAFASAVERGSGQAPDSLAKVLGRASSARFTVALPSGKVVGDTDEDPSRMENHGDRPEIMRALAGAVGMVTRYSDTERRNMMYVAIPLRRGVGVVAALRVSVPITLVAESLHGMHLRIFLGGLLVTLLAAGVGFILARRITRPLDDLKRGIARFGTEGLGYRLPVSHLDEVGSVAEVVNDMAARLDERMRTEARGRSEQEAIFSSMVEGLIVVDTAERVTRVNEAAERFLGLEPGAATGKTIQEAVRNPSLQELVTKALAVAQPLEKDIVLHREDGDRYLNAHAAALREGDRRIGAVIVLHDVTRLQRLENVRREFVANVSHELKTPITSIKGFIETLRDGAARRPADAQKFLEIVAKQADRMNSIIEDLLLLSKIEQDAREEKVVLERQPLKGIILEAVEVCEPKARDKDIPIVVDCPEGIAARVNAALLEQAVINLLDNAIKYSEPGRPVRVDVAESDGEVLMSVRDKGPGIDPEHLPRLFERFYRVDKARSRRLGGTGLGLSIAKHIVQAHGGSITVESAPGAGSIFTIHLPKAPASVQDRA
jgi:two-component system phosphate regulon sensor histidine kinase PhoR